MANLTTIVTKVEVTDPRSGETYFRLSRPIIDAACIWDIFINHYHGRMDVYQALTTVDGRLFDRRGALSKADLNRARNVFRAVEKYGREHGQPCLPVFGRDEAIDRQVEFANKYRAAEDDAKRLNKPPNEYWSRRSEAAGKEARHLPRGKTGVRLANTTDYADHQRIRGIAIVRDQISDTHAAVSNQYAETIGLDREHIKLQRQRTDENAEAEQDHSQNMDDLSG